MDYPLTYQALIQDPNWAIENSLRGIFSVEQGKDKDSGVSVSPHEPTDQQRESLTLSAPANLILRHHVSLKTADAHSTTAEQISQLIASGESVDFLFYHFNLESCRAAVWELQSLLSNYPTMDIIVCVDSTDYRWTEAGQQLEGEENLQVVRTPLACIELRQLLLLLIRKRQHRSHLGRVCQEREQHLEARTRHLSAALEESRRLLSAIDLVLIEVDHNQIVRRWNHEAEQKFGLSERQAVGQHIRQLGIPWDDLSEVNNFLSPATQPESRTLEVSFRIGNARPVVLNLTRHTIHHPNEPNGVLALGVDLTEQRHLQQHLQQAQRLESVGQLAAGVAHEINTPMQYIGDNIDFLSAKFGALVPYVEGTLRLLQEDDDLSTEEKSSMRDELLGIAKKLKLTRLAGQIPDAFSDSQQGLQHVTRIVRAMKELSHPGGLERTAVNVNHLLETAMTVCTNEWKYVAEVHFDFAEDRADVPGFPGELSQVFLNLIINAAHAVADENSKKGREKGRIEISSRQQAGDIVIGIQDNGGGIPVEIRDRIFDPFFTTKDVGKGTGQGLAIAHAVIVKKHGGRIEVQPIQDGGTLFQIYLPIERPPECEGGS